MLDARPIAPAMSLASRRLTLPPWLRSSHVSYFPNDALRRIHSAHAFHVRAKLMPFVGPFLLVLTSRTLKIRGSISLVVTLKSFPARCWPEAPCRGHHKEHDLYRRADYGGSAIYSRCQMRQALLFGFVSRPISIVDKVSSSSPLSCQATKNPADRMADGASCFKC